MIIITRGYPASGKTTWAKSWVRSGNDATGDTGFPQKRARVNRDEFRSLVFAADGVLTYEQETLVTKLQREAVVRLVKGGYHVVIDDTNLRLKYAPAWVDLAVELDVDFLVRDFETDVDTCCKHDYARMRAGGRYVSDEVIRDIAARFPIARWPEVTPSDKAATRQWPLYVPDESLPKAYIVDIDGTIAAKQMGEGSRGWHQYDRVGEDQPKQVVIDVVNSLWRHPDVDARIVFVSGRKDSCRWETRDWLIEHVGSWATTAPLYMRKASDNRADDIVKNEIFERDVAPFYNVLATIDDRQRVVDMWRAKGITCLQVDAWEEAGK